MVARRRPLARPPRSRAADRRRARPGVHGRRPRPGPWPRQCRAGARVGDARSDRAGGARLSTEAIRPRRTPHGDCHVREEDLGARSRTWFVRSAAPGRRMRRRSRRWRASRSRARWPCRDRAKRRAGAGSSRAVQRAATTRRPARKRSSRRWRSGRTGGQSPTQDLRTLLPFYETGRAEGGFEAGIQRALERILVSPYFLFRAERAPARAPGRISDLELASRLSFFLWSSIPDDELIDVAARNALSAPAGARAAGQADAGRSAGKRARRQLRRAVAVPAQRRRRRARPAGVSRLRRGAAPRDAPRNRAVRARRAGERSQCAGAPDGGLHVRQRAARQALRHRAASTAISSGASRLPIRRGAACSARRAC